NFSSPATVAIAIPASATSPVATPTASAAIAEPFAAAAPSASVPTSAVRPFGTPSAMFLRDRSSAELRRRNEEAKIRVVCGDLPSLGPFVSRTVQVVSSEFEGSPRTRGHSSRTFPRRVPTPPRRRSRLRGGPSSLPFGPIRSSFRTHRGPRYLVLRHLEAEEEHGNRPELVPMEREQMRDRKGV